VETAKQGGNMKSLPVSKARQNLYRLIDETAVNHEPVIIAGKRHNAVLLSEEDWQAVQETLYLISIPGMRESIREGLTTPLETCEEDLEW
jgi:antitoxin YefM